MILGFFCYLKCVIYILSCFLLCFDWSEAMSARMLECHG